MAPAGARTRSYGPWILCLCLVQLLLVPTAMGRPTSNDISEGETIIGIDFGAVHGRVGVVQDGKIEILPPELTSQFSPLYIAFTHNGTLFGEAARHHASLDPRNTVFGIRDLMGRKFSDMQADIEHLPFQVISNNDGHPMVQINVAGVPKQYTPEELYGMVLTKIRNTAEAFLDSKIRDTAEAFLGSKITKAVITIPTRFKDPNKNAVKDAGTIAGLSVVRQIYEPTAAGIGHDLDLPYDERNVLVYTVDETLSLHIIEVDQGVFEYFAEANDISIGRPEGDLEGQVCFNPTVGGLAGFPVSSQSCFSGNESFAEALFNTSLEYLEEVLKEANLSKGCINDLIMIGHSPILPELQTMLENHLGIRASNVSNPRDAVVIGATRQARVLAHDDDDDWVDWVGMIDIAPLSLGIETTGGIMTKFIQRNSIVPTRRARNFTTAFDNQTTILVKVYAGERLMAKDNILLGQFEMNIPPSASGALNFEVSITLEESREVKVTARNLASGQEQSITAMSYSEQLYNYEIVDVLVAESAEYEVHDALLRHLLPERWAIEGRLLGPAEEA